MKLKSNGKTYKNEHFFLNELIIIRVELKGPIGQGFAFGLAEIVVRN